MFVFVNLFFLLNIKCLICGQTGGAAEMQPAEIRNSEIMYFIIMQHIPGDQFDVRL